MRPWPLLSIASGLLAWPGLGLSLGAAVGDGSKTGIAVLLAVALLLAFTGVVAALFGFREPRRAAHVLSAVSLLVGLGAIAAGAVLAIIVRW